MKSFNYIVIALMVILFASCEKDNLKEPNAKLTGRLIFQGQSVGVRSSGIQFEIWQPGYQVFSKIPLNIAQDGTFSAALFNGDYKIVRSVGAGPWADNTDTINVKLSGATSVDIPVEPYFTLSNVSFVKNGAAVTATFTVTKNTTTKTLELVRLYIGPNYILDQNNNAGNVQAAASAITAGQPVTMNINIPAGIANDVFVFARVGVKTAGVAELLYTDAQKIQLK
ncbi:MAG TPA: DUF3823 domain-containing protein [Flavisolibacter sp.]